MSVSAIDATSTGSTGTVMVSGNMPAFSASFTGTQSVTSNSITKVTLNTKQFDTANAFDATTNYRFTPLIAGYYQFSYAVKGDANSGTLNAVNGQIYKNGSEPIQTYLTGSYVYPTSSNEANSTGSILLYMNGSTDYVELYGKILGTSPYFAGAYLTGFLARSA